jgi:meso-butanediol dehydrogenase/(S,S)-butanediol dehydrogenase/diacetyl reductase
VKTAVVTGSASGIGRATAERLTRDGWHVIGIDIANGDDAADADVLARAVSQAAGRLDGLVCAAGLPPTGPWDDLDHWSTTLRVDLTAPFLAVRASMPALAAARGSVVLVGSIVGSAEGSSRSPAYAAAKSGLGGLVKSMALIGARQGVRVNLVEPGAIDTPFDPPLYPPDDRPDVPLGRMGTADEVAAAIVFLLSDDATYITGSTLRVDGGRTIDGPPRPPAAST